MAQSTAGAAVSARGARPGQGSPAGAPLKAVPFGTVQAAGRQIVQSAHMALSTAPTRIDDVAQGLFDVVGTEHGFVQSSTVTQTGGADGFARFDLRLPSTNLPEAMARLSRLRYAAVQSRTDQGQDVTDQHAQLARSLADARALRTALLRRLAGATTTVQVQSLNGQLRDADAAITRAQSQLEALNRQIGFSSVSVTVQAASSVPVRHTSHGFTATRALHDAGAVLAVAGAVALLVLALLVPLAALTGLAWWLSRLARRHGRERALDAA